MVADLFVSEKYKIYNANCFELLDQYPENSFHAIVTDPPYGLREFSELEKSKLRTGKGGVWRQPSCLGGHKRAAVPRFTTLTANDISSLVSFFVKFAKLSYKILVPGAHVIIASHPLLSHYVYMPFIDAGFEKRGEIMRLVQTLRGGDRPKNAEEEFSDVTVMPKSAWEPWGIFRKPCEGKVQDNLRKWKTGGLRRIDSGHPFCDVIKSSPTPRGEREIAPHPALKPQAFMRQVVRASLPLAEGIVLDPFMGAGSTIAAALNLKYGSVGIECDADWFIKAKEAITELAKI